MFSESVVTQTGQSWKLWLGVTAMVFGSVAPLFESASISWTVGTLITVAGYGFAVATIYCPNCKQRWFWKALLYAEMYRLLFTEPCCPGCAQNFGRR